MSDLERLARVTADLDAFLTKVEQHGPKGDIQWQFVQIATMLNQVSDQSTMLITVSLVECPNADREERTEEIRLRVLNLQAHYKKIEPLARGVGFPDDPELYKSVESMRAQVVEVHNSIKILAAEYEAEKPVYE